MDEKYMSMVIDLAKKGEGYTNPNPLVGAIIVKDERVIGSGYHQKYGENHAEVNALNSAIEDVNGATMYVNLEPCSHYGKTPPCVDAIIRRGIKKVVVGMQDPNELVAGKGIKILRDNGIMVKVGVLEKECKKLNEIFIKYITTKLPFCILKSAVTLDGKIATYTGDSKYITNEKSREYVHMLRHKYSSIMVGINTVINDNPKLNTRLDIENPRHPIKIILDSKMRIPMESEVLKVDDYNKTIIVTGENIDEEKEKLLLNKGIDIIKVPLKNNRLDLRLLTKEIGAMGIDSILLEGGSTLNYYALEENIVDKINLFIAPKIIGGDNAKSFVGGKGKALLCEAINLSDIDVFRFGDDIMIQSYIRR